MTPGELAFLARTAAQYSLVVEVGCYEGRSTRAMADALRPGCRLYAVDRWQGTYRNDDGSSAYWMMRRGSLEKVFQRFKRNLADHIDEGRVIPMPSSSVAALKTFERTGIRPDMVFLDGDHRYECVHEEIRIAKRLIRPGGVLMGHDYGHEDWPGVAKAVADEFGHPDFVDGSIWVKGIVP
jgi:predicted O-methyltransferase YrrM